ncbi:hypothetical protein [Sphingobacterium detergens]|uniref:Uncharacterized protein n=1 Tax=Sphingobacterium detergens TaxID=1145106 RepID=A0A420BGZ9_SPHD1|nr:hypothetical protein [Sphingobacterium detergens]RKE55969.1 hypothetical protein DFQ12_0816 [Sphingobacterium detergens]
MKNLLVIILFMPSIMIISLLRQLKNNAVLFRKSMSFSIAMNKLTVLESKLLSVLAQKYQALNSHIEKIYVVEKECTGVGQYVFFKYYDEEFTCLLSNISKESTTKI